MATTNNGRIPVHTVKGKTIRARLAKRIEKYEHRYEVSSDAMALMVECDAVKETAEIIRWMQAYHALLYLKEKTRMTGTHGTTTEVSTNNPAKGSSGGFF